MRLPNVFGCGFVNVFMDGVSGTGHILIPGKVDLIKSSVISSVLLLSLLLKEVRLDEGAVDSKRLTPISWDINITGERWWSAEKSLPY